MNRKAVEYLSENKNKFTQEALIIELKKAGYAESGITESVKAVFGNSSLESSARGSKSFWDFKLRWGYQNSSEKWKDFLFGFFAPWAISLIFGFIPLLGLVVFGFEIYAIVYLFKRRKFISYGFLANFIISLVLLIAVISFFAISNLNF